FSESPPSTLWHGGFFIALLAALISPRRNSSYRILFVALGFARRAFVAKGNHVRSIRTAMYGVRQDLGKFPALLLRRVFLPPGGLLRLRRPQENRPPRGSRLSRL